MCRAVRRCLTALTPVSLPLPPAWPLLLACAVLQFAIGSVLSIIFWTTGLVKPPKLDAKLVCAGRGADRQQTHTAAAAATSVCQQAPQPAEACAGRGIHCSSVRTVCCALHHSGIPLLQQAGPPAWIRVALRVCVAQHTHTHTTPCASLCCCCCCCCQISSIYPLAIIHVLGNVLTNVSLGKVAVSFTHTVKVSRGRV